MASPSTAPTAGAPPTRALPRPEILAPAGDWECARAAVENGADAIYFGLERFNARMRAHNFTQADLPALMSFLHRRGVRGYVTFNTLVFANELADAERYLRSIIAAGVDAAIVQDIGICRLIRRISPDFPIHGSTQMTVTSAAGVEFARELGAQLVVLARENSIAEIARIQETQRATGATALPLEVFVHGALCVAYSGQCLTSESLGGRSANRGECAQACRLPYDLLADGKQIELGDRRYLLSPQDLAGLEVLPDLVRNGVASLKIEGRLKTPEYVASITRVYRQTLDRVMENLNQGLSATPAPHPTDDAQARYELEMSFSRGLSTGWFRGIDNQSLVHARFGTKRGVFVGEIAEVSNDQVRLTPVVPIKPGDGVVFDAGTPDTKEEGGRVYQVYPKPNGTWLAFGDNDIDFRKVRVGQKLWKTSDPELARRVRQTFEGEQIRFQRALRFEVHGHAGAPLTLICNDEDGHTARVASTIPLAVAEQQPLTAERLRAQLGRLGGTPFALGELRVHLEGAVMLPVSELNRLRRDLVTQMESLRASPRRWTMSAPEPTSIHPLYQVTTPRPELLPTANAELILVVRSLAQFEAAVQCDGVSAIYCDFENPKRYRDAVAQFRAAQAASSTGSAANKTIWVAPPRITKPGEEWILQQVRSCEADGYLVRNYDHLNYFKDVRRRGDFSLNVANGLTAEYFISRYSLERVTASYDLNVVQLTALLESAPPQWFDITIHQHMPMFHMEHCVFCAFLSSGKDYRDCGRPCEKHDVRIRDRVGAELPLKADAGCRNTVYNNRAQTGAEYVERLLGLGARSFRIEFVNESADEVRSTAHKYRQLLRGEIAGAELWRELKALNQLGVTRGQMETAARGVVKKR